MEKELLETLKAKSREERLSYFNEHKSELLDEAEYRNPDSEVPDRFGNWLSSWNFVCRGREICK